MIPTIKTSIKNPEIKYLCQVKLGYVRLEQVSMLALANFWRGQKFDYMTCDRWIPLFEEHLLMRMNQTKLSQFQTD